MAPKHSWAKADESHPILEDGLGFVQPVYGVTAALFEQGKNLLPLGGRMMHLPDTSG